MQSLFMMSMIARHDMPAFLAKEVSNYLKSVNIIYTVIKREWSGKNYIETVYSSHIMFDEAVRNLILCWKDKAGAFILISKKGEPSKYGFTISIGWLIPIQIRRCPGEPLTFDHMYTITPGVEITHFDRRIDFAKYGGYKNDVFGPLATPDDFHVHYNGISHPMHAQCILMNKSEIIKDYRKSSRAYMWSRVVDDKEYEYLGEVWTPEE